MRKAISKLATWRAEAEAPSSLVPLDAERGNVKEGGGEGGMGWRVALVRRRRTLLGKGWLLDQRGGQYGGRLIAFSYRRPGPPNRFLRFPSQTVSRVILLVHAVSRLSPDRFLITTGQLIARTVVIHLGWIVSLKVASKIYCLPTYTPPPPAVTYLAPL